MKPQDLPVTATWGKQTFDCFSRTLLKLHLTDLTQLRAQTYLHFIRRHAFPDHMFNPHVSLNLTELNQTALKTVFRNSHIHINAMVSLPAKRSELWNKSQSSAPYFHS